MANHASRITHHGPHAKQIAPSLLAWFATNARDLPWRRTRDPYAIWVSEIMLQQTQVKTVIPYWERWLRELPTIESLAKAKPEKIPSLKPAFSADGTVTAANASAISDGAAALVLMRRGDAEKQGKKILATVVAQASHAHEPQKFTTAPVPAIQKALARAGWKTGDVDLWEINEAFAIVPMIAMKELGISHDIINVNGGACALGHPIGASGARVLVTLLAALEARGAKRGVASLCIGGGEGIALAVERA